MELIMKPIGAMLQASLFILVLMIVQYKMVSGEGENIVMISSAVKNSFIDLLKSGSHSGLTVVIIGGLLIPATATAALLVSVTPAKEMTSQMINISTVEMMDNANLSVMGPCLSGRGSVFCEKYVTGWVLDYLRSVEDQYLSYPPAFPFTYAKVSMGGSDVQEIGDGIGLTTDSALSFDPTQMIIQNPDTSTDVMGGAVCVPATKITTKCIDFVVIC